MKQKYIFLYVTTSTQQEAKNISHQLLTQRYIACANIFPINSMYEWKRKITSQQEYAVILKTTEGKANRVKHEIEAMHSYTIPCIIKIPVVPNASYATWLSSQLQGSSRGRAGKS
ncbi:MAG: divalent-cation tolerance protein CutA [Nanoarchaeota archaeon]